MLFPENVHSIRDAEADISFPRPPPKFVELLPENVQFVSVAEPPLSMAPPENPVLLSDSVQLESAAGRSILMAPPEVRAVFFDSVQSVTVISPL